MPQPRQSGYAILSGVNTTMQAQLRAMTGHQLDLKVKDDLQQLLDYLESYHEQTDVLILGLEVIEPVRVAQCVYTITNHISILILAESGHYEQLKQTLKFSPFLGSGVRLWSTEHLDGLADGIMEASQRVRTYRNYRSAMEVSRSRLAAVIPDNNASPMNHYLGRVLDNIPIGIINVDIQGKILGMNRHASQILRRTERDTLGVALAQIFPGEEAKHFTTLIAHCVAPTKPATPEVIDVSQSTGSERYLEVVASSLVDRSGQLGATLILRNVTARICAEKERRKAEAALRISERSYRELVQTMSEGLVVTDAQQIVTYVNKSFCQMLGYSDGEIIDHHLVEFVAEEHKGLIQKILSHPSVPGIKRHEVAWATRSGDKLLTLASQKKIVDPALGHVGCLGVFTDITERKRIESNEKKQMLELAHMSRITTIGEMNSQIAHELAQPLAAIAGLSVGCLKLFRSGQVVTDEIEQALTDISDQSERAREIVLRLRNFVRNEEVQHIQIGLNELVRDVIRFVEVETRWNNLPVQLDLSESMPMIVGDRVLLEQVILNLIHNAIEAMSVLPPEQRFLVIRTGLSSAERASVAVIDSGPGMSDDVKAKIFDPFFTTKAKGMGMGLAITRSIIKAHHGSLTVESTPKARETSFQVCFPLAKN